MGLQLVVTNYGTAGSIVRGPNQNPNYGSGAYLEGRHQWGLILPSSARVSLVTYQTVIAVRYPDLVHIDSGEVSYGMFFSADPGQAGGFLPIVWDVPGTDMEAADAIKVVTCYLREKFEFGTDAADSLTVLHNRTNMVRVFGNSVTVKNSGGETRTRCVTSCAGSTAFLSVVAQTRRGFLSGGSARQTANLNDVEKDIQLEEAYARATVALTRARRLCVLLCPLNQKGPIGAATILGCLQYGLGYLQHSHLEMPLWRGFFLARCCLGQVPGGAPFSQRSEQATACTNRMQIKNWKP